MSLTKIIEYWTRTVRPFRSQWFWARGHGRPRARRCDHTLETPSDEAGCALLRRVARKHSSSSRANQPPPIARRGRGRFLLRFVTHPSTIQGAGHAARALPEHMRIDHRRLQVTVSEELLHSSNVSAVLEQVGRKAMSEHVARRAFLDAGPTPRAAHRALNRTFVAVIATLNRRIVESTHLEGHGSATMRETETATQSPWRLRRASLPVRREGPPPPSRRRDPAGGPHEPVRSELPMHSRGARGTTQASCKG